MKNFLCNVFFFLLSFYLSELLLLLILQPKIKYYILLEETKDVFHEVIFKMISFLSICVMKLFSKFILLVKSNRCHYLFLIQIGNVEFSEHLKSII